MSQHRKYIDSHPWLDFSVNLTEAPVQFWMNLGEAQSKSDHIAGVPLPKNVADKLHEMYLAKGVLATTAIEGNTLTETQVLQQLEGKLDLPLSKEYLKQEVQNIIDACNEITTLVTERIDENLDVKLDLDLIKRFNAMTLKGLGVDKDVVPGQLRRHSVMVGRYRGAPAEDCDYLLQRMVDWLNELKADSIPRVAVALLKAMLAHLYIAWIHPFGDGNGRTARLIELYILCAAGIPTPAAHLLSNHYNETRAVYYKKLEESQRSPMIFLEYAVQGFIDGLKVQLQTIRDYQWDLAWRDHVFRLFDGKERPSDRRRLHLLLDLGQNKRSVKLSEATQISPRVAADYAVAGPKSLNRDVKYLEEQGLIVVRDDLIRAKREIVLRFLPIGTKFIFEHDQMVSLIVDRFDPDIDA